MSVIRSTKFAAVVMALLFGVGSSASHAVVHPLEIFTSNGSYYDSSTLDIYVELSEGEGEVDFTFYNESLTGSSVARIYFDDGSLLDVATVTSSAGTTFSEIHQKPGNLPNGAEIGFYANREFSTNPGVPPPVNGVNPPDEWVKISFSLTNNGTLSGVIDELNAGILRIGVHIIDLPDGSSESAVTAPEPASILLLGLGALALARKRRA